MKKKILKIFMLIVCAMLILSIVSNVNAAIVKSTFTGELGNAESSTDRIVTVVSAVLLIIRIAGVAIAVVILMVIACKYMIASAGDRADIKKYAMSYIIGAVIMFGTAQIAGLLQQVITGAFNGPAADGSK